MTPESIELKNLSISRRNRVGSTHGRMKLEECGLWSLRDNRSDALYQEPTLVGPLRAPTNMWALQAYAVLEALLLRLWVLGTSPTVESGASILVTINAAARTSPFTALSLAFIRALGPDILKAAIGR